MTNTNYLKVCTLSGTEEMGRNCSFVELGSDIVIIDCGLSFPGEELYGIDYLIPNIEYLKKNKHKIKGILITHGHLDHTGALPYVIKDLGYPPIYAGKFANALIKERMLEFGVDEKLKCIDVDRSSYLSLGAFKISFIGVTHSIPNAFSIFIETKAGNIFFSGDYKIDHEPANELPPDYSKFKSLKGKIDLALMESTKANIEGKAKSETYIAGNLLELIQNAKGRVVVSSFSSLISRIYSLIKVAQMTKRKVFLSGKSLQTALSIAIQQQYIKVSDDLIVQEKKLKDYSDDQILFLCTGSQGEKFSALNRISKGEHKFFKVKKGDTFIISASEIPDNVLQIQHMTDRLIKMGAELIKNDLEDVHESGHGFMEDMKIMFEMTKPAYVMPIHGWTTIRYQNKKNFIRWGLDKDKVLLTDDGQVWELINNTWKRGNHILSKPVLIDGLGVGDIGDQVIKDRQQLATYGVLMVIIKLDPKSHTIIDRPEFISRGFVYAKTSQKLLADLEINILDSYKMWYNQSSQGKRFDIISLREIIEKQLKKTIMKKTEREPMILSVII